MNNNLIMMSLAFLFVLNIVTIGLLIRRKSHDPIGKVVRDELRDSRKEFSESSRQLRQEISVNFEKKNKIVSDSMSQLSDLQSKQLDALTTQVQSLVDGNQQRFEMLRKIIKEQLNEIRETNEKKIEEMRLTVDEKLQGTLEKRLGESFKLVSDRLEAVHKGLGEMQGLASGVGDLKNLLSNVKVRGTWAEYQLSAILEQVLTPEQFDCNVITREGTNERVEFAIRLPGKSRDSNECVWLPIDSKFPQEDYLRLVEASQKGDIEASKKHSHDLIKSITVSAKTIADKYLDPPKTTDFAVLYLPTEGLYAEVIRHPGLIDQLQQDHRIVVSGPTTIAALLNSLRLGFRSLAIEKQASEVWQVLSAVKTEFGKFGEVLAKVKKQLSTASNTLEQTEQRTRAMARKLNKVEQLPDGESKNVFDLLPEDD